MSVSRLDPNVGTIGEKPAQYSDDEWQARIELAAVYRLVHLYGWTSQVYNHITARIGDAEEFLINPFGMAYDEICASNLIKIDLEGNKLEESPYPVNAAGYTIHSAIHSARPDLQCVLHTHSFNAMTLACTEGGFIPMTQTGFMFYDRVSYHEYEGIALDLDERERLIADFGPANHTMLMYNHGLLTGGHTIPWAFVRLYHFEEACGVQLRAMASGRQIKLPSKAVMEKTREQFEGGAARAGSSEDLPEWPAHVRRLDRIDPSWRT